jgi:hypothetical protein
MAQFTYTRIDETMKKTDYDAWLTNLTSADNTRIIYYEEKQAVDSLDDIKIKLLLEVETP